uniref:Putative disease resistance RPP13-like protein 1 n=1 Tax=Rhizophora mucronata TaxID=61149 RepID=A0A2P2JFH1_RHIMU
MESKMFQLYCCRETFQVSTIHNFNLL